MVNTAVHNVGLWSAVGLADSKLGILARLEHDSLCSLLKTVLERQWKSETQRALNGRDMLAGVGEFAT